MKIWVIIPARGGSKTIPRKNMQPLGGKPLIAHVLDNLREFSPIVATDDAEIEAYARASAAQQPTFYGPYSSRVLRRKPVSDEQTLDEFDAEVCDWLLKIGASPDDALVMVQPTSPFITAEHVKRAVDLVSARGGSVVAVRKDRKLRWANGRNSVNGDVEARPLFHARVNRQYVVDGHPWYEEFAETGGIVAHRIGEPRFGKPVTLLKFDGPAAIDIDTVDDWAIAARALRTKPSVWMGVVSGREVGTGHERRRQALQQYLGPWFDFDRASHDIAIFDVLQAEEDVVAMLRLIGVFVVCFEDVGPGARTANMVINDLYSDTIPGALHGVQWSVVNPCFERVSPAPLREQAKTVLLTFGGTDPSGLTRKVLEAIAHHHGFGRIIVVLGHAYAAPGARAEVEVLAMQVGAEIHRSVDNMAALALQADIAITSAGRTVTEMMTLGIPTIVLCQNERETTHTHATADNGVINLGLGRDVAPSAIVGAVEALRSLPPRQHARELMLKAVKGRSNQRVAEAILNAYEIWKMERSR